MAFELLYNISVQFEKSSFIVYIFPSVHLYKYLHTLSDHNKFTGYVPFNTQNEGDGFGKEISGAQIQVLVRGCITISHNPLQVKEII